MSVEIFILALKSCHAMTIENILSQVGMGTKRLTERYSEYPAPVHDQHVYYAYEPPAGHGFTHTGTKHNFSSGLKSNASMSALTLLAFLFFLHILQQCIKDHMNDMGGSPIMVMTAGKEGEANIAKSANKIDKSGVGETDATQVNANENRKATIDKYDAINPYENSSRKKHLTKIPLAEKAPSVDKSREKYHFYKNSDNVNQSPLHPGFTSDANDENY